jgi:hypothetical protein
MNANNKGNKKPHLLGGQLKSVHELINKAFF